jgi:hypothetical protein
MIRTVCIAFVLLLAMAVPVNAGPWEDSLEAVERGDHGSRTINEGPIRVKKPAGAVDAYTISENGEISHDQFAVKAPNEMNWTILPNPSPILAAEGQGHSTLVARAMWVAIDPASADPCHDQSPPEGAREEEVLEWVMDCSLQYVITATKNITQTLHIPKRGLTGSNMRLTSFSSDGSANYFPTDGGSYLCLRYEGQSERAEGSGKLVLLEFGIYCMHPQNIGFVYLAYSERVPGSEFNKARVEQAAHVFFRSLRIN